MARQHPVTTTPSRQRVNEYAAWGIALSAVGVVTLFRILPGVGWGDVGELQLACVVLGIAHPPGYPGYLTLGHVLTRMLPFDAAYDVSLACWGLGFVSFWCCIALQRFFAVPAAIAGVVALIWVAHPRAWAGFLTPEVYMPTLAATVLSVWATARYSMAFQWRNLWLSGLSFGLAASNRPPILLLAPFMVGAVWATCRSRGLSRRRALPVVGCWLVVPVACLLYSASYVLIRDQPSAAYNYLDEYDPEGTVLPDRSDGAMARLGRAAWLLSGAQFRSEMGLDARAFAERWIWLARNLVPGGWIAAALLAAIVGYAAYHAVKHNTAAGAMLIGLMFVNLVFLLLYRVEGQEADTLPMLWSAAVLAGIALSQLAGRTPPWIRKPVMWVLLLITVGWTVAASPNRPPAGMGANAEPFLEAADLEHLPEQSVIFATWLEAPPLWYEQRIRTRRDDLLVLYPGAGAAAPDRVSAWSAGLGDALARVGHRPVFLVRDLEPLFEGYRLIRANPALWRAFPP